MDWSRIARRSASLLMLLGVVAASGAACPLRRPRPVEVQPPRVAFMTPPTLAQVIDTVNANSARVQSLQTEAASISVPGFPSVKASMALQRPRNFRLRAKLVSVPVVDVGSNDALFWFWVTQSPQQAVLFARHDQFAASPARELLPVEPTWLPEALGLPYLDPQGMHRGPLVNDQGNLVILTQLDSANGPRSKRTEVHRAYGWVLRQDLFDGQGNLLASARASDHRVDSATQVSLPHKVEVYLGGPEPLQLTVEISSYTVNQLYQVPPSLWSMPEIEGYPPLNLAASVGGGSGNGSTGDNGNGGGHMGRVGAWGGMNGTGSVGVISGGPQAEPPAMGDAGLADLRGGLSYQPTPVPWEDPEAGPGAATQPAGFGSPIPRSPSYHPSREERPLYRGGTVIR